MNSMISSLLAAAALCASGLALGAVGADDTIAPDSTLVAGKSLRLNGAGLGQRLVFKVYAIGLYLPEARHTVDSILDGEGPSRISIQLLRDVSNVDFAKAIADSVATQGVEHGNVPGAEGLIKVGMAIAAQPQGLRQGDHLTIDWVPGVGTVIELNRRALMRPDPDRDLYKALLNVWLGSKPADSGLKERLLGMSGR